MSKRCEIESDEEQTESDFELGGHQLRIDMMACAMQLDVGLSRDADSENQEIAY